MRRGVGTGSLSTLAPGRPGPVVPKVPGAHARSRAADPTGPRRHPCRTGPLVAGSRRGRAGRVSPSVVKPDQSVASLRMEDVGRHWEELHATKADDEVSWFRAEPASSLRLLEAWAPTHAGLVDVGAGSSPLVDRLLDAGWHDLTVLDVAATALAKVRERLSGDAGAVTYTCADVRSWRPGRTFAAWHDRAVFHFLVDPVERSRYVEAAADATVPAGVVVLATFAADGPTQCSGLPTSRYDADELATCFDAAFDLVHAEREEHLTPFGSVQPFTWVVLRRR